MSLDFELDARKTLKLYQTRQCRAQYPILSTSGKRPTSACKTQTLSLGISRKHLIRVVYWRCRAVLSVLLICQVIVFESWKL